MLPTGSKKPTVLMLGEAPGANEDKVGKQFIGKSGKIIRDRVPKEWEDKLRWSNSIRCRPPENRNPTTQELTCCRPLFERDILETKPKAIFGFGYYPLAQVVRPDTKYAQIGLWRGRRIPVDIEGHRCWYYPMFHPAYLIYERSKRKYIPEGEYGSEAEFAFELDLKRAFADLDDLPEPIIHTTEQATANVEIVDDVNRIATLLDEAAQQPSAGYDLETKGLRPYTNEAKILTASVSTKNRTFSFCLDHPQSIWSRLERKQIDVLMKRFLYESSCKKISHNLPFEMEWSAFFYGKGCLYEGRWEDTQSQAYLLDARRGALSLDFLCLQYFGVHLKEISGLDRKNLDKAPIKQVLTYNALDARYHRLLYLAQHKRIKSEGLIENYEHQLRRIPALVLAQMTGVPVDQSVVKTLKKKYTKRAEEAAAKIAKDESVLRFEEKKGRVFNPGSPQDVNYLIKEILKVEIESTEKSELAHIDHPIAKLIVQYREPTKNISTYIDSVSEGSENLYPDGMLHPTISTTTVITWRSSSEDPNIQNFPKHDDELKEVRSQIKSSDPNIVVVSIDYAGIQARNVAMESLDKNLVNAYWNNYDIHSDWRDRIVKRYPKWIPKSKLSDKEAMKGYRQLAKNKFVFATFFGAQSYTTSQGLEIPRNICEELREEFFDQFKDIEKWHKHLHKFYYENGYVTGLSGFRRRAPVSGTELINTPIQSDESIIVLDAMARLSELEDPRYQPALEVHDDLTFFWPKREVEKRLEVVVKEMVTIPFKWANVVPIEVEASWGPDWINMSKIGSFANNKWDGIVEIKGSM